eukprot:1487697-Prorocentrum_lima.AAC.1
MKQDDAQTVMLAFSIQQINIQNWLASKGKDKLVSMKEDTNKRGAGEATPIKCYLNEIDEYA